MPDFKRALFECISLSAEIMEDLNIYADFDCSLFTDFETELKAILRYEDTYICTIEVLTDATVTILLHKDNEYIFEGDLVNLSLKERLCDIIEYACEVAEVPDYCHVITS